MSLIGPGIRIRIGGNGGWPSSCTCGDTGRTNCRTSPDGTGFIGSFRLSGNVNLDDGSSRFRLERLFRHN